MVLTVISISLTLFGISCSSQTQTTTQTSTSTTTVVTTPATFISGTIPVWGVISDFNNSSITLDTAYGKLVLKFDSNTVIAPYGTPTIPVNTSYFKQGMVVIANYNQTNSTAVRIDIPILLVNTPVTGTVGQIQSPNFTLNTTTVGQLVVNYNGAIVIKSDGTAGTMNDITQGINVLVYYNARTKVAAAIEIQK